MFDRSKTVYWGSYNLTVGKLIEELSKYDKDTKVTICGDDQAYLHVDVDPDNKEDFEIVLDNMSAEDIEGDETDISLKNCNHISFDENGEVVTMYPLEYPEKEDEK